MIYSLYLLLVPQMMLAVTETGLSGHSLSFSALASNLVCDASVTKTKKLTANNKCIYNWNNRCTSPYSKTCCYLRKQGCEKLRPRRLAGFAVKHAFFHSSKHFQKGTQKFQSSSSFRQQGLIYHIFWALLQAPFP